MIPMIGKSYAPQTEDLARKHFINLCFEEQREKHVVDIGCGDGELTEQLALHFKNTIGVDKGIARSTGLAVYQQADFSQSIPRADVVTASFVFHLLPTPVFVQALKTIHSSLHSGGKLIFVIPHPRTFFASFQMGEQQYTALSGKLIQCSLLGSSGQYLTIPYFHRTIIDYLSLLEQQGFVYEKGNCKFKVLQKDRFDPKHPPFLLMKWKKKVDT